MKKLMFILIVGSLFGQNLPPQSDIEKMSSSEKMKLYHLEKKSPALGVFYSILLPTAGHAYAGNWGRGLKINATKYSLGLIGTYSLVRYFDYYSLNQKGSGFECLDNIDEICDAPTKELNKYGTSSMFFYIATLGVYIYELIDVSKQTNNYNKNIYKRLFPQEPTSIGFNLQPTYNGATLTMSYALD